MTATFIKSLGLNAFSISSARMQWMSTTPHNQDPAAPSGLAIHPGANCPLEVERNGKTFQPLLKSLPAPSSWPTKTGSTLPTD